MTTYIEIGSEFWDLKTKDLKYLLVGRTALDHIIKDIKATSKAKKAYLPTYCCHTMIQPFIDNNIDVLFYEVNIKNGAFNYDLDYNVNFDIVLIMQYFGIANAQVDKIAKNLKDHNKIVIEDTSHSVFLDKPYTCYSDYTFTSFRKWTGLACGAVACKNNDAFAIEKPLKTNKQYIDLRTRAASLKKQYIDSKAGKKDDFLNLFSEAENLIETDYRDYSLPEYYINQINNLDTEYIKTKRRLNAKTLYNALKDLLQIETLNFKDSDVPLFVPILVKDRLRDQLRAHLTKNNIYCPIHWPLSPLHKVTDTYIYDNILSLVCDQRYSPRDMIRIADVIKNFYK